MTQIRVSVFHCRTFSQAEMVQRHPHLGIRGAREHFAAASEWREIGLELGFDDKTEPAYNHRLLARVLDDACGARNQSPIAKAVPKLWDDSCDRRIDALPLDPVSLCPFPNVAGKGGSLHLLLLLPSALVEALPDGYAGDIETEIGDGFKIRIAPPRSDIYRLRYRFFACDGVVHPYQSEPPTPVNVSPDMSLEFCAAGPDQTLVFGNTNGVFRLSRDGVKRICGALTDADFFRAGSRIAIDAQQTIWVATASGLARIDDEGNIELPAYDDLLPSRAIAAVSVDDNGRLLAVCPSGVGIKDADGSFRFVEADVKARKARSVHGAPNGDVWIHGDNGLLRIDAAGASQVFTGRQKVDGPLCALLLLPDSRAWVIVAPVFWQHVGVEVGADKALPVGFLKRNQPVEIVSACMDSDERLWMLLENGNLYSLREGEPPRTFALATPKLDAPKLHAAPDGGLWIVGDNCALSISAADIAAAEAQPALALGCRPEPFSAVEKAPDKPLNVEGRHVALLGLAKAKAKKAATTLEAHGAIVSLGCDEKMELAICSKRALGKWPLELMGVVSVDESWLDTLAPPAGQSPTPLAQLTVVPSDVAPTKEGTSPAAPRVSGHVPTSNVATSNVATSNVATSNVATSNVATSNVAAKASPPAAPPVEPEDGATALQREQLHAAWVRIEAGEAYAVTLDDTPSSDAKQLAGLDGAVALDGQSIGRWNETLLRLFVCDCVERLHHRLEFLPVELLDNVKRSDRATAKRLHQFSPYPLLDAARRQALGVPAPEVETAVELSSLLEDAIHQFDSALWDASESLFDDERRDEVSADLEALGAAREALEGLSADSAPSLLAALDSVRLSVDCARDDVEAEESWQLQHLLRYRLESPAALLVALDGLALGGYAPDEPRADRKASDGAKMAMRALAAALADGDVALADRARETARRFLPHWPL